MRSKLMLANYPFCPVVAVKDLERARRWYAEKLGLHPARQMGPELVYELGGATLLVYETDSAGTAQNTVA
jgi:catechol 2,3-dioxygenase-like lactoylglutathione lyase family enzyme